MNSLVCKTVGHSNRKTEELVALLKAHGVTCVIDVRSQPYSRFNPQFNRETLKTDLAINEINYIYLGDRLGARYDEPDLLFPDGTVDFSKVRTREQFQQGITQVIDLVSGGTDACIMCAEKEPFDCHRFVLVSRELGSCGVRIEHILTADSIADQSELEDRLIKKYKLDNPQVSLFEPPRSRAERRAEAYQRRNHEIGYRRNESK
ncbi:MAG: DUF488 domain-containing protein [Deltaproteobacteria bacterium]|nr:DUF488 domain-containing protein [Deltaproteobacteria bacterium]